MLTHVELRYIFDIDRTAYGIIDADRRRRKTMQGHDYEFLVIHRDRVRDMQRSIAGHPAAKPVRGAQATTGSVDRSAERTGDAGMILETSRRSGRPVGTPRRPVRRLVARVAEALVLTGTSLLRWADAR
jgi:hypothetical protein